MGVFDRQVATAKRQITKNGAAVRWRQYTNAQADPDREWKVAPAVPVDYPVRIAFFPLSGQNRALLQTLGGDDRIVGNDFGLMPAVNFDISLKADIIAATSEDVLRTVLRADPIAPNGQVIMYTVYFEVT